MLSFFRVNDPYRIPIVLLILSLIRLPYLINADFTSQTDLVYMAVGEMMANGHVLYREIWETAAPFTSLVYYLVYLFFGKTVLPLQLLAILLVIVQAAMFNAALLKNKAFNENCYVPALIYALLASTFFDFNGLSPALLSLTFIIPTFNYLFQRIEQKTSDSTFVNTGWLLGLASLFYLPSGVFLLSTLLTLILFTSTILRRYLLVLIGYFLPISLTFIYFLYQESSGEFWNFYLVAYRLVEQRVYFNTEELLLFAWPVLIFFIACFKTIFIGRYVNYQVRYMYVMIFNLLFGGFSLLIVRHLSPNAFLLFVPGITFFLTHFFLAGRKTFRTEVVFVVFVIVLLAGYYYPFIPLLRKYFPESEHTHVFSNRKEEPVRYKTVMAISADYSVYRYARATTPYLNSELAALHLNKLDYYDNLTNIYKNIMKNSPQLIIDDVGYLPAVFEKIPLLKAQYRQISENRWELNN